MSDPARQQHGPIQDAIERKLAAAFDPTELAVMNESYMHSVPPGSESHFKVVVVSQEFAGMTLVARHRAVNQALADEIAGGIHALSIEARSQEEWDRLGGQTTASPKCLGGSKATAS